VLTEKRETGLNPGAIPPAHHGPGFYNTSNLDKKRPTGEQGALLLGPYEEGATQAAATTKFRTR
jgi:hypothetical protein